MNDFLDFLAEKKWRYYHFMHKRKPQAYTSEDCYERIKIKAKYDEIMEVISGLPFEQEKKVQERFEELTENF